jgi:hypothetical protein
MKGVIVMAQLGQVVRMKSKTAGGDAFWGYRYRVGGRGSRSGAAIRQVMMPQASWRSARWSSGFFDQRMSRPRKRLSQEWGALDDPAAGAEASVAFEGFLLLARTPFEPAHPLTWLGKARGCDSSPRNLCRFIVQRIGRVARSHSSPSLPRMAKRGASTPREPRVWPNGQQQDELLCRSRRGPVRV